MQLTPGKDIRPTYATSAAVGQAHGDRKGRKPPRVTCASLRPRRKSTAQGRKPSAAPKTANPTTKLHRRSRTGNWSQKGCGTLEGEPAAGNVAENRRHCRKRHRSNTRKKLNNSLPCAEQEERKKTQLRRHRKSSHTHTHTGTTREEARS